MEPSIRRTCQGLRREHERNVSFRTGGTNTCLFAHSQPRSDNSWPNTAWLISNDAVSSTKGCPRSIELDASGENPATPCKLWERRPRVSNGMHCLANIKTDMQVRKYLDQLLPRLLHSLLCDGKILGQGSQAVDPRLGLCLHARRVWGAYLT